MILFGAISYLIVAVLYAALFVLLLTGWRGKQVGGYLIAACIFSTMWAVTLAAQMTGPSNVPLVAVFAIEVVRGGAWLAFLLALLAKIGVGRSIRYAVHVVWLSILAAGIVWWLLRDNFPPQLSIASIAIPGGLIIAFSGLILIEQLYRNTPADSRWRLKMLALGLGSLFAYDLFMYSQGMLFGVIDNTSWVARGAVNTLFVPLIALAARRNPDWELKIFVSRQVVFYSTSLIAVGVYLLLTSLGGYALVIYGGTWGELAQLVFFAGAILVLVALLFSSSIRARTKVFLSKHFFHNRYDYREEWLRLISTLADFEDSSTRQIVVKSMAQIVNSPGGLLWALNDDKSKYDVSASYEMAESSPDIPADSELAAFIRKEGWVVDLEEYKQHPDIYGDLALPDWLVNELDIWLIVPLMFRQQMLGLVMLIRPTHTPKLNYEDRDLLKTVGNHLAVHLAQEKSDSLLAEAQQFEAYNRLTAFLMHDLNNLIAQQSLIIKNAEKHKRNPDFVDDAIQTIANSVERMKHVMDQLKRKEADRIEKVTPLKFIVSAAVDRCSANRPMPNLNLNGVDVAMQVDREQFTMVLSHLIQNAQDATGADGSVDVSLEATGTDVMISVADTGCGMSSQFIRDHLFRPFDSTKGSQGMGIGAYQAREFARKMRGDLKVVSALSLGTTMTMVLPLPAAKFSDLP